VGRETLTAEADALGELSPKSAGGFQQMGGGGLPAPHRAHLGAASERNDRRLVYGQRTSPVPFGFLTDSHGQYLIEASTDRGGGKRARVRGGN